MAAVAPVIPAGFGIQYFQLSFGSIETRDRQGAKSHMLGRLSQRNNQKNKIAFILIKY